MKMLTVLILRGAIPTLWNGLEICGHVVFSVVFFTYVLCKKVYIIQKFRTEMCKGFYSSKLYLLSVKECA